MQIRESICRDLEQYYNVQNCIIVRQVGLHLYVGKCSGKMVYIPVRESSIFTQTLETRKVMIVNEPAKDRQTIAEVRGALNILGKLQNLMIVPFGENKGKFGGTMLLILINKYTIGEDDKITNDSFNLTTNPACNKTFQLLFSHVLDF